MVIITGVSTAEEFVGAINEKGASLTNRSTPEELLEAINATGGNVSYQSPNNVIVEAVNTEVPTEEFDLVFKTFFLNNTPYVGTAIDLANENISFPEEYWIYDSGMYVLKDNVDFNITIGNLVVTALSYAPSIHCFMFGTGGQTSLADLYDTYTSNLYKCPVSIQAPAGIIKQGDAISRAVNLEELILVPHAPQWLDATQYEALSKEEFFNAFGWSNSVTLDLTDPDVAKAIQQIQTSKTLEGTFTDSLTQTSAIASGSVKLTYGAESSNNGGSSSSSGSGSSSSSTPAGDLIKLNVSLSYSSCHIPYELEIVLNYTSNSTLDEYTLSGLSYYQVGESPVCYVAAEPTVCLGVPVHTAVSSSGSIDWLIDFIKYFFTVVED